MSFEHSKSEFQSRDLGATATEDGTGFSVYAEGAEKVEVCLFDDNGEKELSRTELQHLEGGIWSSFIAGIRPAAKYGYRAHGPYNPEAGLRYNANKLLLDPYAKSIAGDLKWDDALYGYKVGHPAADLSFDERDSAPFMPKSVVTGGTFEWEDDTAPRHSWNDTIIYECHAKGFSMLNPNVPPDLRGTVDGLVHQASLDHLKRLGITAVELLPCHAFLSDRHLVEKGLSNYWGYQTIGFFAPHAPYLGGKGINAFKSMVKTLHRNRIEVIMDVVFNHTAEGNELGPTLSFRGLDNLAYYMRAPDAPRHAYDTTGTGNSLNVAHPMVLRMVLDSLRYWVQDMHVDGFRFDLASTLGRGRSGFDREGQFLSAIRQDPVLAEVKLIAEPWDVGHGGYQVGGFPVPFREWNDKFRDDVRSFWKGDVGLVPAMAERLIGSPVQFNHSSRNSTSSINLLAAHDGFTLKDCVSYNNKHNEANGEDNRDGHNNNYSSNMGEEGPTENPDLIAARNKRLRNLLTTLFVSQGIPTLLAGDEFGNTQLGNNNAYCQDDEISWLKWPDADDGLIAFVSHLIALRKAQPALRQGLFLTGVAEEGHGFVQWFGRDGKPMTEAGWKQPDLQSIWALVSSPEGRKVLMALNAGGAITQPLPATNERWRLEINTQDASEISEGFSELRAGDDIEVPAESSLVLIEA